MFRRQLRGKKNNRALDESLKYHYRTMYHVIIKNIDSVHTFTNNIQYEIWMKTNGEESHS